VSTTLVYQLWVQGAAQLGQALTIDLNHREAGWHNPLLG